MGTRKRAPKVPAPCVHCGAVRVVRARGLCYPCYARVRPQYPRLVSGLAIGDKRAPAGEPTEAELERTIAEQMRCLPAWWWADVARMNGGPV